MRWHPMDAVIKDLFQGPALSMIGPFTPILWYTRPFP